MLRRALLALLAFCLAIPAVAAPLPKAMPCHDAGLAMPRHHAGQPAPATAPVTHECIGCATPLLGAPVAVDTRAPAGRPVLCARAARLAMRATTGPDSPPPRA